MIELQSLVRLYGQKKAVDGIDLVVPRGQLFASWARTAQAKRQPSA